MSKWQGQKEKIMWESVCMDSAIDQPQQATGLISQERPETERRACGPLMPGILCLAITSKVHWSRERAKTWYQADRSEDIRRKESPFSSVTAKLKRNKKDLMWAVQHDHTHITFRKLSLSQICLFTPACHTTAHCWFALQNKSLNL